MSDHIAEAYAKQASPGVSFDQWENYKYQATIEMPLNIDPRDRDIDNLKSELETASKEKVELEVKLRQSESDKRALQCLASAALGLYECTTLSKLAALTQAFDGLPKALQEEIEGNDRIGLDDSGADISSDQDEAMGGVEAESEWQEDDKDQDDEGGEDNQGESDLEDDNNDSVGEQDGDEAMSDDHAEDHEHQGAIMIYRADGHIANQPRHENITDGGPIGDGDRMHLWRDFGI